MACGTPTGMRMEAKTSGVGCVGLIVAFILVATALAAIIGFVILRA